MTEGDDVELELTHEQAVEIHMYAEHATKTRPESPALERWEAIKSKVEAQL